ncbi:ABC transporter ATP-binding protein [Picrophilus oshimae]|uniref:NitT/TauT family transport system ATP-binding protein n=1 Tax=Picrophilus torridus (strain ATCC 700027 / DSM 9790 / JCM 10055 / NBRC 100828 / KAW 2/3) TaxID=1122961 RepID=Q6L087_PICTO|nr:ABC transporter ATP-binding protein [Picrophilus oshimae]AAT43615.1 sugar ABC transporter 1, ATP binding protein [Picrophilus oshimae DSM 9789]SMD31243.1 NitT/TauT family transport system ATP-binding protein [Picrophilus oshimae DSM 9789]
MTSEDYQINQINEPSSRVPVLQAINISFSYENGYRVFQDVNLEAGEGKFVAIIGPSGIGKSTFLRILGGFLKPDSGYVKLMGKLVLKPIPEIALIHQSIVTFPWMTALENVMLSMKSKRIDQKTAEEKAREALARVGLEGFEDLYPKEMSGGMRQRVAIARAFAADPYVFLMDEPFAHLDELTAEGLRQDIYNILFSDNTLKSVVMVSHNLTEVLELADDIFILNGVPASVVGIVHVDMPRPRNPKTDEFNGYLDKLYNYLTPPRMKK